MKKILFLALLLVFALAIAACGGSSTETPPPSNETTDTQPPPPPTDQGDAAGSETDALFTEDFTGEATQLIADVLANRTPVTITYANWNINEAQEMPMIEEFMRRFDFITVEVVHADAGSHIENLHAMSMAGTLPDVFAISQVPDMLATGFLRDILPYGQQFDDWHNVPAQALNVAEWRGRVFAMPFSSHFEGIIVNDDLWDAHNLPRIQMGFSLEQFLSDLRTITNIPNGIGGTNGEISWARGWLPHYFNNSFGAHTWDGQRLHLNSPEYIDTVNFLSTLRQESLVTDWGWITGEEMEVMNAGWMGDIVARGDMPFFYNGSWWFNWMTDMYNDGMNFRYVGLPGNTIALFPTFAGISVQSQNPAVAMLFLNWMAFGEDGLNYRLQLRDEGRGYADEYGNPITYSWGWMPATANESILHRFFAGEVPGMAETFAANMHNAVLNGEGVIPGNDMALHGGNTGLTVIIDGEAVENASVGEVIWSAIQGNINFADYADAVNEFANRQVDLMRDEINFMLDMMGFAE